MSISRWSVINTFFIVPTLFSFLIGETEFSSIVGHSMTFLWRETFASEHSGTGDLHLIVPTQIS